MVRSQERMVVPYAIQRLMHNLLLVGEFRWPAVFSGKCLDHTLHCFDIALELPPAPLSREDLMRGNCDERATQEVEHPTSIKQWWFSAVGVSGVLPSPSPNRAI